ncbi:MAG: hypothetical protein K9L75_05290, partial [Spirochaetia bacterium]|nr:hypothetical protein [Spirochaetia bacterium]
MNIMNILGDIIIPIFSGIIFLVFAAYFLFSQSLTTKASRFFVIYLFSFGLFVLLRPVQLFLGPYPTPMYINTIRSFIMMSISIPCLVIANFSFVMPVKRNMTISFIAVGIVLGIVYGLFNSSAQESFIAFTVLGLPAYEPLLPASLPPLFAREVTIGVYVLGGMQVAASSFLLMYKEIKTRKKYNAMRKKFLMFGLGSLILGLSIIFGVLVKLWWIYYTASLFSSLLAGAGILADIRELQTRIDKTVPFIKGELANLVRFYRKNNNELFELLNILEYSTRINTCVLLECRYTASQENSLELFDILFHDIEPLLLHEAGENCFFLLPIGRYKIGICLALGGAKKQNKNASIELSERLLAVVKRRENLLVTAGIGRTKEDASGLSESYHEAATAQAYAAFFRKNQVVHIDDVQDPGV